MSKGAYSAAEKKKDLGSGKSISAFVSAALSGSARNLLEGQSVTVAHAIDAPSSQLRVQVGMQIRKQGSKEGGRDVTLSSQAWPGWMTLTAYELNAHSRKKSKQRKKEGALSGSKYRSVEDKNGGRKEVPTKEIVPLAFGFAGCF